MPLELYPPEGEAAWLRSFSWSRPLRPRFFETDAFGHVNNVFYVAYLEQARLDYFNALDDPEHVGGPFGFVHHAAEITLRFARPCFYDEPLAIHTRLATLGRSSAILEHAITAEQTGEIRTLARVAIVGMRAERPTPWTHAQREILALLVTSDSSPIAHSSKEIE